MFDELRYVSRKLNELNFFAAYCFVFLLLTFFEGILKSVPFILRFCGCVHGKVHSSEVFFGVHKTFLTRGATIVLFPIIPCHSHVSSSALLLYKKLFFA